MLTRHEATCILPVHLCLQLRSDSCSIKETFDLTDVTANSNNSFIVTLLQTA